MQGMGVAHAADRQCAGNSGCGSTCGGRAVSEPTTTRFLGLGQASMVLRYWGRGSVRGLSTAESRDLMPGVDLEYAQLHPSAEDVAPQAFIGLCCDEEKPCSLDSTSHSDHFAADRM